MHLPPSQSNSQSDEALTAEIGRSLREALAADRPRPPASSDAAPAPGSWGPTNPRAIQSPLALLAKVAADTVRLQEEMARLVARVTGETPGLRAPTARSRPYGLLPAISMLATEIEQAHADLARMVRHVERRLG